MTNNKQNFAVNFIERGVSSLKDISNGKTLDDVLDKNRGDTINSALADCLFHYFRNKVKIDYIISNVLKKKTKKKFTYIILIAYIQSKYQNGISQAVAVDCAVAYSKKKFGLKIAAFINGTLRKLLSLNTESILKNAPEHVKLNIPELLFKRWSIHFEKQTILDLSDSFAKKPAFTFRIINNINSLPKKILENSTQINLPKWADDYIFFETNDPKEVFNSNQHKNGNIYIQDPSTVSPCSFYLPKPEDIVYDLCSAPGGKSLLLLEKIINGILIAADSSYKRQLRTYENLNKTNHDNLFLVCASSLLNPSLKTNSADFILLDVPCSNTGVIRRRPDVLWNFSEKKLTSLLKIQKQLLREATKLLKPGGSLVYSTCSIEPEENQRQIDEFLSSCNESFQLKQSRQLMPSTSHDGGYSALLIKN